jgi:hypothetical protein
MDSRRATWHFEKYRNQKLDIMKGSTPSKTEKGAGSRGGVGHVKAPASPTRVRVRRIKEKERM